MKIYILTRDLVDEGLAKGRVEFLGCFRTAKEVLDAIMQEENKENLSYIEKEFEPESITISRDSNDDLGQNYVSTTSDRAASVYSSDDMVCQ